MGWNFQPEGIVIWPLINHLKGLERLKLVFQSHHHPTNYETVTVISQPRDADCRLTLFFTSNIPPPNCCYPKYPQELALLLKMRMWNNIKFIEKNRTAGLLIQNPVSVPPCSLNPYCWYKNCKQNNQISDMPD